MPQPDGAVLLDPGLHDYTAEALSPVQSKVDALLSPPILRHIIDQPRSTIDLAGIMDDRRVLIANLSKSALGEGPTHLIGAFLATAFAQAADAEHVDFYLYVDEFQNFATDSFATILSEARKWSLSLGPRAAAYRRNLVLGASAMVAAATAGPAPAEGSLPRTYEEAVKRAWRPLDVVGGMCETVRAVIGADLLRKLP